MSAANVKIIQPSGILTAANSNSIVQELVESLNAGTRIVLLDLQQIHFIDSSGLGLLVSMSAKAKTLGGKLCLCAPSKQAQFLFEITDMGRLFEIYSTQVEFFAALEAPDQSIAAK